MPKKSVKATTETKEQLLDFLRQMRDFDPFLVADLAFIDLHLARQDFHERGFSDTVTPEQRDALAGVDLQADAVKKKRPA